MRIYNNYGHDALRFYKSIPTTHVRPAREIAFDMNVYACIDCDFIRDTDIINLYF